MAVSLDDDPAGNYRYSNTRVLRAGNDWERDIEPVRADPARTRFDYRVELRGDPFCYFKPVLVEGGRETWALGSNYLGVADAGAREVYPHFFGEGTCRVCRLERRVASDGRAHRFRVFTPPGYDENTLERYPVLFMQDGKNLFFPEEAFGGQSWRVDETLRQLNGMSLVRRVIVVGVWPEDRMEDYTKPGYEAFGRFLAEEMKPWVDSCYRTLAGPENAAVLGSSLGGVVSFYLAWEYPHLFGQAGCMSSTFGWKDDLMDRVARERKLTNVLSVGSGFGGFQSEVVMSLPREKTR